MMKLRHSPLSIAAGPIWLEAMQAHSPDAPGLILIAQSAVGHHRDSREAHFVQRLQKAGYATLLFALLTRYEENRAPDTRYNAPLLGTRIGAVFEWLRHQPPLAELPVGLVASGTGSAAAVRAVAKEPEMVGALVCRGGRPSLAGIAPLRQTIQQVSQQAMETIGETWADPPDTWLFNHRWKDGGHCPRCRTPLIREDLRGRTCCWCPKCQKA